MHAVSPPPRADFAKICHSGVIVNEHGTAPEPPRSRRDPLSLGFEAHRGLLLLRLRLRDAATARRSSRQG
jgi:hypothetical protein